MKNLLSIPLVVAFLTPVAIPYEALAFEATLPQATSQALVARVTLFNRDSDLLITNEELPTHSYMASAVTAVYPSIKTEPGKWPVKRKPVIRYDSYAYVPRPIPTLESPVILEGEASYYSRAGCLGCDPNVIMANGQPLNDSALTMAIGAHLKHLVGHTATVTNLATGQSVDVKITDTGGFYQKRYGERVADLTIGTKTAIGIHGGLAQVRVVVK